MKNSFKNYIKVLSENITGKKIQRKYLDLISNFPMFDSMSMTPVNQEWRKKWEVSKGKRILLYTHMDFSGSLYKWAEAINRYSEYAARLVTSTLHPYGYNSDILAIEAPVELRESGCYFDRIYDSILKLVDEADIIHYKEEQKLFRESMTGVTDTLSAKIFSSAERRKKPQVFTLCGSIARKYREDQNYIAFVDKFQGHIAMTPDLNFEWFKGLYIPHAIDTDKYSYAWNDGTLISHSPSSQSKKGTSQFTSAMKKLADSNSSIRYDVISGVPYDECLNRKRLSTMFFDQAGKDRQTVKGKEIPIGWYGNSAIEAMAFGIPTMAYISENAIRGAERAGVYLKETCPVINVACEDADSIYNAVSDFLSLSEEKKREISKTTRNWAVSFHGYKAVAAKLASVYDKHLK